MMPLTPHVSLQIYLFWYDHEKIPLIELSFIHVEYKLDAYWFYAPSILVVFENIFILVQPCSNSMNRIIESFIYVEYKLDVDDKCCLACYTLNRPMLYILIGL